MSVAATPILQKQQAKLPTFMRYERVQDILQNDNLLKTKLGPRSVSIDTRFGEKLMFSKEAIEVTEAIHAEGKDAHKVPKAEVLRMALRVMKVLPSNGESNKTMVPVPVATLAAPANDKTKPKARTAQAQKAATPAATPPPAVAAAPKTKKVRSAIKPATKSAVKPIVNKPAAKPEPVKSETVKSQPKAAKPVRVARSGKPEPAKEPATTKPAPEQAEEQPESELPPERQPLHLPVAFDPRKYPHYKVQVAIYSLLLSALNMSEHFEKLPGKEERQRKLELLIKEYLETCDPIKIGT